VMVEAASWFYFSQALRKDRPDSRKEVLKWLKSPHGTGLYKRVVGGVMDRIDAALVPKGMLEVVSPRRLDPVTSSKFPYTWTLLDFALRIAIAYPILFISVAWGLSGEAQGFGAFEIYPDEPRAVIHYGFLGGLLVILGLLCVSWYYQLSGKERLGGAFQIAAFAFAVAVALALAFAFAGAVAFAVAFAGAVAFVVAFAVTVVALALAFALLGALRRTDAPSFLYVYYLLSMLGLSAVVLSFAPIVDEGGLSLILFWIILPILNALFDFLSFGTTRLLIRWGLEGNKRTFLYGLGDLAIALIYFTGLGFALVLTITVFNTVSQTPILDLGETLLDIRENPGSYWWLYAGFFSTLLPTFLHFGIACFSIIAWVPGREKIAGMIEHPTHGGKNAIGQILLSLIGTIYIAAPVLLIVGGGLAILNFYPSIGAWYLWTFVAFAKWLGVDVDPAAVLV